MTNSPAMEASDKASMLLGMAFGLAHTCCGAAEELDPKDQDFNDVVMGLRHIKMLVGEAKDLMGTKTGPAEVVRHALAVCTLMTTDIAVELDGRYWQHWSDEITAWSLHSLCDVIERAKAAVDGPGAPAHLGEVAHA